MRNIFKKSTGVIKDFFSAFFYGLEMSWKASSFYTGIRLLVQIFSSVSVILISYFSKRLIDYFESYDRQEGEGALYILITAVLMIFIVKAVNCIFDVMGNYAAGIHEEVLVRYLQREIMAKTGQMDIKYFDTPVFYDTLETTKRDLYAVSRVVWSAIFTIGSTITAISAWIIMSRLHFLYGILIAAATIPSAVADKKYTKKIYGWGLKHAGEERQMQYIYQIMTSKEYAADIRLFQNADDFIFRFTELFEAFIKEKKAIIKIRAVFTAFLKILPEMVNIFILVILADNVLEGRMGIGDFSFYFSLSTSLTASTFGATNNMIRIYEEKLKIDHIRQFHNIKNDVIYKGNKKSGDIDRKTDCNSSIEFRHVFFRYPNTEELVLDDISFNIKEGEKVCLAGLNGSGKSTIIKLLLRFYDISKGTILLNGTDIREYDINWYRNQFTILFQNFASYAFTLKENITLSGGLCNEADYTKIQDALKFSGTKDILKKAKYGLEQYVTKQFDESGMEMSGGELQKLALARTFYRDSPILILDEPSSSLDPEAEYRMFQSLNKLGEKKTVLYISHRMYNMAAADKIILIENGKITGYGNHEDLMKENTRYMQLYNYQTNRNSD